MQQHFVYFLEQEHGDEDSVLKYGDAMLKSLKTYANMDIRISLFCLTIGARKVTNLLDISDYKTEQYNDERLSYGIIWDLLKLFSFIENHSDKEGTNIVDLFTKDATVEKTIVQKGIQEISKQDIDINRDPGKEYFDIESLVRIALKAISDHHRQEYISVQK